MGNVKLHTRENPVIAKLNKIDTHRVIPEEDYYQSRPLRASWEPEVSECFLRAEDCQYTMRREVACRVTMAVVLKDRGNEIRGWDGALYEASKQFAQFLYSPLLDDLAKIEHLIYQGQKEDALDYIHALKYQLIGEIHG